MASPETASDADYAAILGVIGHEVCHKTFVSQALIIIFSFILVHSYNDHMITWFILHCLAVFPQLDWQQVVFTNQYIIEIQMLFALSHFLFPVDIQIPFYYAGWHVVIGSSWALRKALLFSVIRYDIYPLRY